MGLFSKRNEVVDLTETVIPQRKKSALEKIGIIERTEKEITHASNSSVSSSKSVLDFMSGGGQNIKNQENEQEQLDLADLAIMVKNANKRIQDQSNELYKLLHKIELLEKKIERLENKGI